MNFNRLLSRLVLVSRAGCRSAFASSKPDMAILGFRKEDSLDKARNNL
uniref:Uncharacterized protein n=1 Tax=Oreochromis aureus TaxID=47969 RepID=A0A668S9T1_OREAU